MTNNFSIEQAREMLATKTGISVEEFIHAGTSQNGDFVQHKFYRCTERGIIYTVLSDEEVKDLEEYVPHDYAQ